MAAELVGRFAFDRPSLPAIALSVNTSSITAIANDYGLDQVFSCQIEALARPGGISTSGDSANVLCAFSTAKEMDLQAVALTGKTGGKLRDSADHCICVPSNETPRIQECHGLISHMLSELVEQALCKRESRVSGSQPGFKNSNKFKLTVSLLFLGKNRNMYQASGRSRGKCISARAL